jgi:hypothetical protein
MGGAGEQGVGLRLIPDMRVISDVAGRSGKDLRRALFDGGAHIGHARQRAPIDIEGFGRVARLALGFGDHHGDGVADMLDGASRENRIGFERGLRFVGIANDAVTRKCAEIGEIRSGIDRLDPRHGARGLEVAK